MKPRLSVGRQRMTASVPPSEAGHVADVRRQFARIAKRLEGIINGIKDATPEAIVYGLKPVYDESQLLVPVDTGALKRSGFVRAEPTTTGATGAVGYAKGGVPNYALAVHENPIYRHKGNTQYKYLSEAVNRKIHLFRPRMIAFIKKSTGLK